MTDTEKQITRTLDAYKSAVLSKDVRAFVRLYDPKVRIFDTWGVWSYEGLDAWEIAVEGWFASLGVESVKVLFEEVRILPGEDFTIVSAIVSYSGISIDGEQLRTMQNRLSWALRMSGHVWRIVHEHTSAPLGFEDQKAILRRETAL